MASHPKRSPIVSYGALRHASRQTRLRAEATPLILRSNRWVALHDWMLLQIRHGTRQQRDGSLLRVVGRCPAHHLLGGICVAETGAGKVVERVIDRISAKRTRTLTVRPGRDFARSRVAILTARWGSVGRNTRSSAARREGRTVLPLIASATGS
jgi:hypothetical protein